MTKILDTSISSPNTDTKKNTNNQWISFEIDFFILITKLEIGMSQKYMRLSIKIDLIRQKSPKKHQHQSIAS